jgi:hypothetical protein
VVTLARLDRADAQPQLAADELRSYLSSGPPADSRRAVLPEFFRAVWDVRQDPQDVSRETAALLDGTEAEKKANLPGLRLAVVALEAVGKLGAAEAVCRAMSEHAAGTPEADWASQWVLKKMGVKP